MRRGVRVRQLVESALIVVSSLRICASLLQLKTPVATAGACLLASITVASIGFEATCAPAACGAVYRVRPCETHGIAQGTLALPSLLAALLAADPGGAWLPWFACACTAALSILWNIHQSWASAAAADQQWHQRPMPGSHAAGAAVGAAAGQEAARGRVAAELAIALLLAGSAPLLLRSAPAAGAALPVGRPVALAAVVFGVAAPVCFHRAMLLLPGALSIGEGSLAVQGALLAMAGAGGALRHLPRFAFNVWRVASNAAAAPLPGGGAPATLVSPAATTACGMVLSFVSLLVASSLLISVCLASYTSRQPPGYTLAASTCMLSLCLVILLLALWTLLVFLPAAPARVWLLVYWCALMAAALPVLQLAARRRVVPQIILRKGYHLLAAALFTPAFFRDLPLLCAALAIAFAALVAAEAARCCAVPRLGRSVQSFMQAFVDARDAGPLYITHFTLLLGLAVPIWLAAALPIGTCCGSDGSARQADSAGLCSPGAPHAVLVGLSGVMVIGLGDTAASAVGRAWGRVPITPGSHKTLEGTLAAAAATLAGWWAALAAAAAFSGSAAAQAESRRLWAELLLATASACLLEACTSQLDNFLIPLFYLPHCALIR